MSAFAIAAFTIVILGFIFGVAALLLGIMALARANAVDRELRAMRTDSPAVSSAPSGLVTPAPPVRELPLEDVQRQLYQVPDDALLREQVQKLLLEGKKIEAVKLVRERTGLSLAETKAWVDRVELR